MRLDKYGNAISSSNYISVVPSSVTWGGIPEFETVTRPDTGDSPECSSCPHNFSCLSGVLATEWMVAGTREDHKTGITLPCVDDGGTKLVQIRCKQYTESTHDAYANPLLTSGTVYTSNTGTHVTSQQVPLITWSSNALGSNTK